MRRVLLWLLAIVVAMVAVPPLVFALLPAEPGELPPPGVRIAVGGGRSVNAIDVGSGPPVVLVHGLPGSGYDWAPLTEALVARGHRVIAYDRIGYGRSDDREGEYTVDANARDLLVLLASADLRDATLVGWSYGGPVCLVAAERDPARIARVVLVGSGGPSDDPDDASEPPAIFAILFSKPVMAWMEAVPPVGRGLQAALSVQAFSEQPPPDWWLPQLAANFDQPYTRTTYREEGRRFLDNELDPSAVRRPILLFHGDDDRLAPLGIGRWIHARAPGSVLEIVPGGSHMLPITHPDLLADRIAASARAEPAAGMP